MRVDMIESNNTFYFYKEEMYTKHKCKLKKLHNSSQNSLTKNHVRTFCLDDSKY